MFTSVCKLKKKTKQVLGGQGALEYFEFFSNYPL